MGTPRVGVALAALEGTPVGTAVTPAGRWAQAVSVWGAEVPEGEVAVRRASTWMRSVNRTPTAVARSPARRTQPERSDVRTRAFVSHRGLRARVPRSAVRSAASVASVRRRGRETSAVPPVRSAPIRASAAATTAKVPASPSVKAVLLSEKPAARKGSIAAAAARTARTSEPQRPPTCAVPARLRAGRAAKSAMNRVTAVPECASTGAVPRRTKLGVSFLLANRARTTPIAPPSHVRRRAQVHPRRASFSVAVDRLAKSARTIGNAAAR